MIESLPACRLRALRLLHPALTDLQGPGDTDSEPHPTALRETLLQQRDLHEQHLTDQLVIQLLEEEPCPLDGLFSLAEHLVDFHHGAPHCRNQDVYHHISRDLDKDLLIAARLAMLRPPDATPNLPAALAWPSVLSPELFQIDGLLQRELVDAHVHLGGALPASFYWVALMSGFTLLERTGAWRNESPAWASLLPQTHDLRKHLASTLLNCTVHEHLFDPPGTFDPEVPPEPFVDYLLRHLVPTARERLDHNPVLGERRLLWHALHELYPKGGRRAAWFPQFLEYLRVRNSFIRHMGFRPGYRGLERYRESHALRHGFSPRADRLRARDRRALAAFEQFRVRHALRYQFSDPTDAPWARAFARQDKHHSSSPWRPPRQVELRVSPWRGHFQMRLIYHYLAGFRDFVRLDRDAPLVRMGLVFHLVRGGGTHFADQDMLVAEGLNGILHDFPNLRPFIVGVDVAGAEKAHRPRDYAAFFDRIRHMDRDQKPMPGLPPIRLKRTMHGGEDYDDPLTGLRTMDDILTLCRFEPGERIGHGLALFFEPRAWYGGRTQLHKRRGDHLIDLFWAYALLRRGDTKDGLQPDRRLSREAFDLIAEAFADKVADRCRDLAKKYTEQDPFPTEAALLHALGLEDRPERLMVIHIDAAYIALVEALRARVIQRASKREIVLEACPTSNMLISGLDTYAQLPYLNLNRAGFADERDLPHPVLLTLNTDNPGNLDTTLANEYRLVARGMLRDGKTMGDILRWLEAVRQTGTAATFIPPWNPPTKREFLHIMKHFFD